MSHSSLSAAADERKARLLQLKNLKRKAPPSFDDDLNLTTPSSSTRKEKSPSPSPLLTSLHLSGRNYDPTTKGPKIGFENPPLELLDKPTLEESAREIEEEMRKKREEEEEKGKEGGGGGGLDLEQLRPKRPNWDLKRDLERKMAVLGVRTDNAIARVVRERIEGSKRRERERGGGVVGKGGEGEEIGMEGVSLVESVRQLEKEDEVGDDGDVDVDMDE